MLVAQQMPVSAALHLWPAAFPSSPPSSSSCLCSIPCKETEGFRLHSSLSLSLRLSHRPFGFLIDPLGFSADVNTAFFSVSFFLRAPFIILLRPTMAASSHNLHPADYVPSHDVDEPISSSNFPPDFVFGFSTAAIQVEGATLDGGRGMSIWDTFAHIPGAIKDGSLPLVACDHYNRYKEDIDIMKAMGAKGYRFSIAWPRILPDGKNINAEGIRFYNSLVNEIIGAGLIPMATLYHWDLPQVLENDPTVKGWRTKKIVEYFALFAETCFLHFGDRIKNWITFNEVHSFSVFGYGTGDFAPGRGFKALASVGDPSTEPYIVTHNVLLSHAAAACIYKTKYQEEQKGMIGLTTVSHCFVPYTNSKEDIDAAERCREFQSAWIWDPLHFGDYPKSMRERVGDRLPKFTKEESESLKGSLDFLGFNYYIANYAKAAELDDTTVRWVENDMGAEMLIEDQDGNPIGELLSDTFPPMPKTPWGLRKVLEWLENRYGNSLPIYITENGCADKDGSAELEVLLDDQIRIQYFREHLVEVAKAVNEDKRNVKGYFAWSIMDNWEWASGYNIRFGLHHVDFDNQQTRTPKASAKWFTKFLHPSP